MERHQIRTGDEPPHGVVASSPDRVTCGVAEPTSKELRLEADAPNTSAGWAAPRLQRPHEPEPRQPTPSQPTPAHPHAVSLGAPGGRLRLRVRASPGSPGIAPAGVRAPLPASADGSQRPAGSPLIAPPQAARSPLDGSNANSSGSSASSALHARFTEAAAGGLAASLTYGAAAASDAEARVAAAETAAAVDKAALAAARADIARLQSALQAAEVAVASLQRAASRAQNEEENDALLEAHRQRERADKAARDAARATQEAQLLLQQQCQGAITAAATEQCPDAAAQQASALLAAAARRGQPVAWDVAMPRVIALSDRRVQQRAGCRCGIGCCARALTRLILRVLKLALVLCVVGVLALQWESGSLTPRHVTASLLQAQARHPQLQRWLRLEAGDGCLYAAQVHRLPLCLSEADRAWAVAGGRGSFRTPAEAPTETISAAQETPATASRHRHAEPFQEPEAPGDRSQPTALPTTLPPPAPGPSARGNESALAWAFLDAAGDWSAGGAPVESV
jgi:hypothetical protein